DRPPLTARSWRAVAGAALATTRRRHSQTTVGCSAATSRARGAHPTGRAGGASASLLGSKAGWFGASGGGGAALQRTSRGLVRPGEAAHLSAASLRRTAALSTGP